MWGVYPGLAPPPKTTPDDDVQRVVRDIYNLPFGFVPKQLVCLKHWCRLDLVHASDTKVRAFYVRHQSCLDEIREAWPVREWWKHGQND